jgi:PDZ domain-containing protein
VTVTTAARSASDPTPIIGIVPGASFDFPVDVTIHLQDVGGPSAGMMFALGIYDTLTPGALTGGEHVAGTGTIDAEGDVGPIGGIRQKMIGARDAGAGWFLAPEANCGEVVGHVPGGLRVFAVSTLDEALEVVTAIGAGRPTGDFASCG